MAMPSPQLPKPPRSLWPSSRMFFANALFCVMAVLPARDPNTSGARAEALLDRLGIDRRAGPPGDHQRRRAKEELVDAVGGAVLGELLEIEDLAVHDPDRRDRDPVPGLEDVRPGRVGSHLDPPGVAADRRDLLGVDPVQGLEGQSGRVAAGVPTPVVARQAVLHLTRADDDEVGASHGDPLRSGRAVEVGDRDRVAVREIRDALVSGHVEQHAPADHLVRELLDAVLVGAAAVDQRGRIAVPHLLADEDVRQRIPLGGGLRRQVDRVVGVAQTRRDVVLAGDRVGARRQHLVHGVPASPEDTALRAVLVEVEAEPEHLALLHQPGGVHDVLGRDVVEDAELVVRTPFAPVLELLGLFQDIVSGQLRHWFSLPAPLAQPFTPPRGPVGALAPRRPAVRTTLPQARDEWAYKVRTTASRVSVTRAIESTNRTVAKISALQTLACLLPDETGALDCRGHKTTR